jgi:hypothetical protein
MKNLRSSFVLNVVSIMAGSLTLLLFSAACFADSESAAVSSLVNKIKDEPTYEKVIGWIDANLSQGKLSETEMELEVGTKEQPKCYLVKKPFDWAILDMRAPGNEVRLVCGSKGEWLKVYLGNLRYGVVVSCQGRGVPEGAEIVYRNKRAAVFHQKST